MSATAPSSPGRRAVVTGAAVLASSAALATVDVRPAHAAAVTTDPFALGIASGDPLATAVVIWTRLVKNPYDERSMGDADVPVGWEVASDSRFRSVVRRGTATARRRFAHTVHVDVRGLAPDTEYWYRFRAGRYVSDTGRLRTTPAAGARTSRVRFAVASCQDFQFGYWPAFTALADEDVDFVVHLGDYIYESDPITAGTVRRHRNPVRPGLNQLRTFADYRARYAQYKLDPALQAAHRAAPWILTWDDHEVENNYANLLDERADTGAKHQSHAQFTVERMKAYQSYWEHQPLRPLPTFGTADYRIYRGFDIGDLVRLNVMDTRQYRTPQPGPYPRDIGPESAGRRNSAGTLTGAAQERWLHDRLLGSGATWNVLAQQVVMMRARFPATKGSAPYETNLDQWDGYAPQRDRLLRLVRDRGVGNPVVLSADLHSTWFNDLVVNPDDPHARPVATELVATSISSPLVSHLRIKSTLARLNPWCRYYDGSRRGYLLMDVDRNRWLATARTVDSVTTRTSPVRTTATCAVEAGRAGVVRA